MNFLQKLWILILGLSITASTGLAQEIGFGCGIAGVPTPAVERMTERLKASDWKNIRAELFEGNLADQILSAALLEAISKNDGFALTEVERQKIAAIKASNQQVSTCSGCMLGPNISASELLGPVDPLGIRSWAQRWVSRNGR